MLLAIVGMTIGCYAAALQEGDNVQAVNIHGSVDQVIEAFQMVRHVTALYGVVGQDRGFIDLWDMSLFSFVQRTTQLKAAK